MKVRLLVSAPGGEPQPVDVTVDPAGGLPVLPEALLPVLNVVPVRRQFFPDGAGGRISLPVAVVRITAAGREAVTLCAFAPHPQPPTLGLRGLQALGLEIDAAGAALTATGAG
jgi:predicted aspartyl protease